MGCLVAWNTAEGTWDCPCHGSRFDTKGRVLSGPAESPLSPIED
jgi:Rieske Fe-S protein